MAPMITAGLLSTNPKVAIPAGTKTSSNSGYRFRSIPKPLINLGLGARLDAQPPL